MLKLSIIVPVYNVERYVEQCIRSLYVQDIPLDEYEVICVDDCSPDGSRAILERLQDEYPNLQLIINERNRKLGGARNIGLKAAKGKYVWFVDSDDYVMPNCLSSLLTYVEWDDLRVLHFNNMILSADCLNPYPSRHDDRGVITGVDFVTDQSQERWDTFVPVAWRALYNRRFLLSNNLWFVDDMMYEDDDWSFRVYALADKVRHVEVSAYVYRVNPYSVTKAPVSAISLLFQVMQLVRCIPSIGITGNELYDNLITEYLRNQSSELGKLVCALPQEQKRKYMDLIRWRDVVKLLPYTSYRNIVRLLLCVEVV